MSPYSHGPSITKRYTALLSIFIAAVLLLSFAFSAPAAHAQGVPVFNSSTQYDSVIEYQTSSGYSENNVNVTWTNTNSCGSFSGFGAGGAWYWGPGVGATPCTSSLPSGTITETASADGTVLATCTDTQGAATYGSITIVQGSIPSECTNTGAGVSITQFNALAYDASGNPIAAPSGSNYDWVIAVVVVIILLVLLFFIWQRRKKKGPMAAAVQATSASPGIPPASATRFCSSCGSPVEPGASFCPKCGKPL